MTESPNEPAGQDEQAHRFPEIDGYDIIDLVGAGGMGMVYEAIQRSTSRRVAVKVMLETAMASPASRQRFEREVEFIARLDHPNIVAVLDSGIEDSHHYCVMDFVEGSLLDDAFAPGECDPREALAMIERIARTVDYAHQRGVLHRDLKPGNVMIDEQGEPHLLDFGLAKAIDPVSSMGGRRTISEQGQLIGTIAYMAPEQARGEISELSVRTDVYALGAIAYELVTGFLPVEVSGSLGETLNRLESKDATRPSSIRKRLRADTDAILLKALEKKPSSRYETAGMFADDIRRMLDGYPVHARRTGPIARSGRWMKRNPMVSTVTGFALGALLTLGTVSTISILDERSISMKLDVEMGKMYASLGPNRVGADVKVQELLQAYADELELNPIDDLRVECEVQQRLGRGFAGIKVFDKAERHQRRALLLRERTGRGGRKAMATSLHELAATLWWREKYKEAAPLYERALTLRESALGPIHEDVAETVSHLATTYDQLGRTEEADPMHRRAIEIRSRVFGDDHEITAASKVSFGFSLLERDKFNEAAELFLDAVEQARRQRGDEYEGVAIGLTNLGRCYYELGRIEDAQRTLEESLALKETIYGVDRDTYAWSQFWLAKTLWSQGDQQRALQLTQRSYATFVRTLGDDKDKTNEVRDFLAEIQNAISDSGADNSK